MALIAPCRCRNILIDMTLVEKKLDVFFLFIPYFVQRRDLRENRPAEARLSRVSQGAMLNDLTYQKGLRRTLSIAICLTRRLCWMTWRIKRDCDTGNLLSTSFTNVTCWMTWRIKRDCDDPNYPNLMVCRDDYVEWPDVSKGIATTPITTHNKQTVLLCWMTWRIKRDCDTRQRHHILALPPNVEWPDVSKGIAT